MFEQLAIFNPQGQVFYEFNCQGKKFNETQINAFVSQLIVSPATKKDSIGSGRHTVVNVSVPEKANCRPFTAMFHVSKQPELYFVITYVEQTIQLNKEAEETLDAALGLWNSLDLKEYLGSWDDLDEHLVKFDKYLRTVYEENIKSVIKEFSGEDSPREQSPVTRQNKKSGKKNVKSQVSQGRKWDRAGMMEDVGDIDMSNLDFSSEVNNEDSQPTYKNDLSIDKKSFGSRSEKGEFLIKEIDDLLANQKETSGNKETEKNTYVNNAFGFLQKHLLGNKTITENDLTSVLNKLRKQLISKNVAPEAADYLTDQVKSDLIGSKTANWTTLENTTKESLSKALTEILTPGVSVDLLHEIQKKIGAKDSDGKKQPYVFSVVGVNGVGKSTNLSKLAFWLLQNNFRVLIVACDTFRSGAVEQLRVHVENLAELMDESHVRGSKNRRGKSGNDYVELFEAGYGGSDLVTKIAKQAIKYARDEDFDIVLMDTAGRRHNDPTLMSPLKSFAEQAKPDKIIMVGEALVGTDSVQQATNFNNAFGRVRNLDFFIISKCDTVGDMLGTMVNMVYATSIPILFVGVGQTYTDLRTLSVNWAVNKLMS
ncbi:hypothetical protein KAFR_0E01410 [Kazachstania africana CBS 2517]|uniref:Signal recognition particle receptor subunit alpha homolog n=1 Tax=Kazachstania africana (strain ATCC 22294 / BCRC 22015 / CBS 2517 / CECT 1963 / NBRC 1671 / NRRL Y-8276) TaxID=1071382 RepID=H2AV95_KAZAF|nr:hypothetical protein KAFR_0E01410 [Kazachstania africana CBS 2517]CCF58295.1 hypothetical protein KAFR_0E01410 [Kazachstania africana CBS 2517]